jgi:hypothetical protein
MKDKAARTGVARLQEFASPSPNGSTWGFFVAESPPPSLRSGGGAGVFPSDFLEQVRPHDVHPVVYFGRMEVPQRRRQG